MSSLKRFSFAALLTKYERVLPEGVRDFARDLLTMISDQSLSLEGMLGNGLIPADNFDWKKIAFTSNATPDTEDTIPHTLKRIPEGVLIIKKDKFADIRLGATAWTSTNIYLKTDVASAALTIVVF